MSTSTHPIIILSDSEDAFSSTNTPNYTPTSSDYFPAPPGNTFSDPLEDLSKDLLPPSPLFDHRDFFLLEEILPHQKRARFLSSSSTNSSAPPQVTMALLPPGFLKPLYLDMITAQDIEHMISPTPPRDIEPPVGSPISLSPSSVGFSSPGRMAPKRTSTSTAPTMTQAAIKKLVADSVSAALEAQAATMANTDNTNRNTLQRETPVARKYSYKEFMRCQPFNFKGNDLKTYIRRFLCPTMVPNSKKLMEIFIGGLPRIIEGNVTASNPQTLEEAITITKRTLHCQVSDLQQGGSSDQELQEPAASVSNLSCMWRERTLQKSVPKSKQQCLWESIHAVGQECSPRSERSHG
ncbi:hypothetical protein Tco_0955517 [Tanacetum coccineum]|uniref:Reverse transcriptase domain-containing protein n=1 Tax=Tanacetum coccineum TaxID=301880 RepID=A0ABQ5E7H9_9ASTR